MRSSGATLSCALVALVALVACGGAGAGEQISPRRHRRDAPDDEGASATLVVAPVVGATWAFERRATVALGGEEASSTARGRLEVTRRGGRGGATMSIRIEEHTSTSSGVTVPTVPDATVGPFVVTQRFHARGTLEGDMRVEPLPAEHADPDAELNRVQAAIAARDVGCPGFTLPTGPVSEGDVVATSISFGAEGTELDRPPLAGECHVVRAIARTVSMRCRAPLSIDSADGVTARGDVRVDARIDRETGIAIYVRLRWRVERRIDGVPLDERSEVTTRLERTR